MKHVVIAFVLFFAGTIANADDVTVAISVTFYECTAPQTDPACVAFDEASKPKSCPDCTGWRKVTVDDTTAARTRPEYNQPNKFVDDVAKQIYGEGLPRNSDGQPVSLAYFYQHHEKYGWVEVPSTQSREGTLALLPNTAGVVVNEKDGDVAIVYSSTKRGGDVMRTDLDLLAATSSEAKFVLPSSYLEKAAESSPPKP